MFGNKMNNELTIVVGIVVFIVVLIMYKKSQKCDKYVTYFDKMYYDLPIIKTTDETKGLNDMQTDAVVCRTRTVATDFDTTLARWAGNGGSQPSTDGYGRRVNPYADRQSSTNRHALKHAEPVGGVGLPTHTEPFADDEYIDPSFSFNKKYAYRPGIGFNDPAVSGSAYAKNIDEAYVNKPDAFSGENVFDKAFEKDPSLESWAENLLKDS